MRPDNNNGVDDQPVPALEQDVPSEPTEATYQPEEEAEQSTGASLKKIIIFRQDYDEYYSKVDAHKTSA